MIIHAEGDIGTAYTTTVNWDFSPDFPGGGYINSDSAIVPVAEENKKKLQKYLDTLYPLVLRKIK